MSLVEKASGEVFPTDLSRIKSIVETKFSIQEVIVEETSYRFYLNDKETKMAFLEINSELGKIGFIPVLRRTNGRLHLIVFRKKPAAKEKWFLNIALFIATIVTTTFSGYRFAIDAGIEPMVGAVSFSASILAILGTHELGHKLMALRRGVDASYPYFIPIPMSLGTLGAVIRMRSPAPNRDSLFDVGAMGPIAGFLVAIPTAAMGIMLSHPISLEATRGATLIPFPPILVWLTMAIMPSLPPNSVLVLHPVAFAAWVGVLITFLNLMPAGQLDGGHLVRTLAGLHWHRPISILAALATFFLGYPYMSILMLWFSLSVHSGPLDDVSPLSKKRRLCAIALFAILLVSVTPMTPSLG